MKEEEELNQKKLPPQKRKRIRTKKGSELYIDSKEMMQELINYNDTGVISEELGEMFLKLARRYTSKPNFVGYSYRDEMISESVHRMVSQIDKFDVTHPSRNPFAYFTQICYHQVLTMINKEKRQSEIKDNIRTKIWDEVCHDEQIVNQHYDREDDN
jgi:DNA-directed RNA polymerase specialized sigma24 family protein